MLRPGHTPGHTNWLIQSGGERLLIWGDIVHLASVQLARPEARLIYDVDTDLAAATRQKVLEWVASERLTVAGAHVGFPGFGRVTRSGGRFAVEAAERSVSFRGAPEARTRNPYSAALLQQHRGYRFRLSLRSA